MRRPSLIALTVAVTATAGAAPGARLYSPALNMNPSKDALEVRMAATRDGKVYVAWIEDTRLGNEPSGQGVFVSEWTGRRWRTLGGTGNLNYLSYRNSTDLDLALDRAGMPVLAWTENHAHADPHVFRAWRGTAWTEWAERRISQDQTLAARSRDLAAWKGEPVLVSGEIRGKASGIELRVKAWRDGTWVATPPLNDTSRYAHAPSIDLTSKGRPVVAWLEGDVNAGDVRVSRWTGKRWEALGDPLNHRRGAFTSAPVVRLGPADRPVVAWTEEHGGTDAVFVKRWTGKRWEALGGALNFDPGAAAERPSLTFTGDGDPVVGWTETKGPVTRVVLNRWSSGGWQQIGTQRFPTTEGAGKVSVAADGAGRVFAAWLQPAGPYNVVRVQQFAGPDIR